MTKRAGNVARYRRYFARRLSEYGEDLRALDYGSPRSQQRRFEILYQGMRDLDRPLSILDLGCGFGDFLPFLKRRKVKIRRYVGVDLVPGMVSVARTRHPDAQFETRDILREGLNIRYDYAVANGIFYLRASDSDAHLRRVLDILWIHARKGVLFNARSRCADAKYVQREPHLVQYSPEKVLEYCFRLTRSVVLRHDYLPHDFTIYMYRDKAP